MADKSFLTPAETARATIESGAAKAALPWRKLLLLGVLAGAYVGFAGFASSMASFNLMASPDTFGLGRALCGAVFAGGLILIVCCGGELFTGNCLILMSVLDRRATVGGMLRNWGLVYAANLLGAALIAYLTVYSGLLSSGADMLGAITIKIASGKTALSFMRALVLGLMCNWLVCLGVWLGTAARDIGGKVLGIFFPIWLFCTGGFEHSVANMFYIPAGLFAKGNAAYLSAALELGVTQSAVDGLTWGSFFLKNLLPVTIGNIIGGAVCVGFCYYLAYVRGAGKSVSPAGER